MQPSDRVAVLASHFVEHHTPQGQDGGLFRMHTSAVNPDATGATALPERLSDDSGWNVYRSNKSTHRLITRFTHDDSVGTLHDNFESAILRFPDMPLYGTRAVDSTGRPGPYNWMTYKQAGEVRSHIGSGLRQLGLQPGQTCGLYSVNCRDWMLVDGACHAHSVVPVPLYDTLGPEAVEYITKHAELAAIACSAKVFPILAQCLPRCPGVKLVIVFGLGAGQQTPAALPGMTAKIMSLEAVTALGKAKPMAHHPPQPFNTATICYTSGTTGLPKGAVLSHENLVADAAGSSMMFRAEEGDVHMSYLPLAHIYERVMTIGFVAQGIAIGFFRGDVLDLLDDMLELQPTIFLSVPRLYNRVYDRVMGAIREGNPVARRLFETAYSSKRAALSRGDLSGGSLAPLWDRLVFSKVAARLGGKVRVMVSGSAPLSGSVMEFLRICFPGAKVIEGYGMTETSCVITTQDVNDTDVGNVGPPIPCCEVKLADLPDMNYTTADQPYPRGEVCVRGPTIFQGYYKDEAQSREAIDDDGWLHTGDIGLWLPGGRLKIIDRKKNIFKLAQGEYVAPEKIEGVYARSPFVAQSFVHGNSLQAQLVAVVVPDPEHLLPWAAARKLPGDLKALCANKVVADAVLRSMQEEGRAAKLNSFEQAAAVHLAHEPFSVDNDMLTPTFKLKRPQAQKAFSDVFEAMYRKLE